MSDGNVKHGLPPPTEDDGKAGNGRVAGGRFAPGNRFSRGYPFARRVSSLRRALLRAVSDTDISEIARKLVELAKAGDVGACRLVFDRVLGAPQAVDVLERLEAAEAILAEVHDDAESN